MRIGIDIRALMEGRTTGVQVYLTKLLRTLFENDQHNQYVLFANSFADVSGRVKIFDYPNVSYKILRFPNKIFNFFMKFFAFPKVDRLVGGLDLFFSPHWRTLALSKRVPLVITFHDLSFEVLPGFFTWRQRVWHKIMNYRGAAARATRLIVMSESTRQDLVDFYKIPAEKISLIHSGVDEPAAQTVLPASPAALPAKYILAFGTFEPRKNLEAALKAYQEYYSKSPDRLPLVLAGSSGWKTDLRIPEEIRRSVYFFSNVSEKQKALFYRGAFLFLFLSFYEGFGFPVLEAASYGVPVIASFATSIAEIGNKFVLFVNPFRPSQVADAMLSLEQDRGFYQSLSDRGRLAVKEFVWGQTAKKTLQLFNETVKV
jgi:glycosyltransferase involved in cell wall biosynthesis